MRACNTHARACAVCPPLHPSLPSLPPGLRPGRWTVWHLGMSMAFLFCAHAQVCIRLCASATPRFVVWVCSMIFFFTRACARVYTGLWVLAAGWYGVWVRDLACALAAGRFGVWVHTFKFKFNFYLSSFPTVTLYGRVFRQNFLCASKI